MAVGSSDAERFGSDAAARALATACSLVGLDSDGAEPMRFGENALFYLPSPRVVVRIARTMAYWDDAVNEVNVSRWLNRSGLPAAEALDISQPVEADGRPVTFWHFIDGRPGGAEDIAALGAVLRRVHGLPRPTTFDLPTENILGRVGSRVEKAPVLASDKDFLLDLLNTLQREVGALTFPLPPSPTHGDAHSENLMIEPGRVVLIDFERFAWGQPEWDLAMTATEFVTAKWWTPEQYAEFTAAYGCYDVMTWDGFDTLRRVHEIKMTTWLMQNVEVSREISDEYLQRMNTMRGGGSTGSWRPF